MKKSRLLFLFALIMLVSTSMVFAANVYVSNTNGDDLNGDGTSVKPYKTIATGITAAAEGDDILIDAGTYGEAAITVGKGVALVAQTFNGLTTVTITNTLEIDAAAKTVSLGVTGQDFLLNGGLTLTDGDLQITTANVTIANGQAITRTDGTIDNTPTVTTVDVIYDGAVDITAGAELPDDLGGGNLQNDIDDGAGAQITLTVNKHVTIGGYTLPADNQDVEFTAGLTVDDGAAGTVTAAFVTGTGTATFTNVAPTIEDLTNAGTVDFQVDATILDEIANSGDIKLGSNTLTWGNTVEAAILNGGGEIMSVTTQTVGDGKIVLTGDQANTIQDEVVSIEVPAAFTGTLTTTADLDIYGSLTVSASQAAAFDSDNDVITVFGDFMRTDNTIGNVVLTDAATQLVFDGDASTFDPGEDLTVNDVLVDLDAAADILTLDESISLNGDLDINQGVLALGSRNLRFVGAGPSTFTNDGGYTTDSNGFVIWENGHVEDGAAGTVVENMIDGTAVYGNMDIRATTDVVIADGATIKFSGILNLRDGNLMFDDSDMQLTDDWVTVPTINYYTDAAIFDNTTDANGGVGVGGVLAVAAGVEYDINYYGDVTTDADFELLAAGIRNLSVLTTAAAAPALTIPQASTITGKLTVNSGEEFDLTAGDLTMTGDGVAHSVLGIVSNGALIAQGDGSSIVGSSDSGDDREINDLTIDIAAGETFAVSEIEQITGDVLVNDGTSSIALVKDIQAGVEGDGDDTDAQLDGTLTLVDGTLTLSMEIGDAGGNSPDIEGVVDLQDGTFILGSNLVTNLGSTQTDADIQLGSFDLTLGDEYEHDGTGTITGDGTLVLDYTVGATSQNFVLTTPLSVSNVEVNAAGPTTITQTVDDLTITGSLTFIVGTYDVNALDVTLTGNTLNYTAGTLAATGGGNFILDGGAKTANLKADFTINPVAELDATSLTIVDAGAVAAARTLIFADDFTQTAGDVIMNKNTVELQADFTRVAGGWTQTTGYLHLNTIATIDHGTNFSIDNLKVEGAAATFPDEQAWRIEENLILVDANLDPGDDDLLAAGAAQLTFGAGATIERQDDAATMADAADYDGDINLVYSTDAGGIETSEEASAATIADLTTYVALKLDRDVTVNGEFRLDKRVVAGGRQIGAGALDATTNDGGGVDNTMNIAASGSVYFVDADGTDLDEDLVFAGDVTVTYDNATAGALTTTDEVEGTVAAPNTIASITIDGAADADDIALHRNMTIAGDLSIIDDGDLDLAGFTLNLAGDYTQSNANGTIVNSGGAAALRFTGAANQTITLLADWTVDDADYTFGVNKPNMTTMATITGGDVDFATNGATLYLDEGILATGANDNIILEQHSQAVVAQSSLNTQPTQGYVVGTGNVSFVNGNVKKYISPIDQDGNIFDHDNDGDADASTDPYDASIALTRIEFPVGSAPDGATPGYDRLFAISFNTLPSAATTLTVSHEGVKAAGENGFPINTTDGDGNAMTITNMANFNWNVKSSDVTLQSQVQFDVEARAGGYQNEYEQDEVEDIRFVRRYDNNDDNPWLLQGATGYDNSTNDLTSQSVVIAQDAVGAISTQGAVFSYSQSNKAPSFTVDPGAAVAVDEGVELTLNFESEDADLGDASVLTVASFTAGAEYTFLPADAEDADFVWTPTFTDAGDHTLIVRATDTYGQFTEHTVVITVNDVNVNPVITEAPDDAAADIELFEGTLYTTTLVATDADVDNTTLTWTMDAVDGVTTDSIAVTAAGVVTIIPDYDEAGATFDVTFTVTDDAAGTADTTITFAVSAENRAPVWTVAMIDTAVDEAATLTLNFGPNVMDPDADALTYSVDLLDAEEATVADSGAIDAAGVYTWTPNYTQAGLYTLVVTASDGNATSDDTVAVEVRDQNAAPTWLTFLTVDTTAEGESYTFTYVANDLDDDDLTFRLLTENIEGLTITKVDKDTCVLTWSPDFEDQGNYLIRLDVTDGIIANPVVTQGELVVNNTPQDPPVFVATPNQTFMVGDTVTVTVVATDNNAADVLTYSVVEGPGTIDPLTGVYTYEDADAGLDTVIVSVTDGYNTAVEQTIALDGLVWGDANMSYDTESMYFSADAQLVLSHSVELDTLTGNALMVANVWDDALVNAYDASLILRYSVDDPTVGEFPIDPALAKEAMAIAEVNWTVENVTDSPERINLPIDVQGTPENVYALEVRTNINSSSVEVNAITSNLPKGWMISHNNVGGTVIISMAGSTPLTASRVATLELNILDKDAVVNVNGSVTVNANGIRNLPSIELKQIPNKFALSQNYPNPFNPTTTIAFEIAKEAKVRIDVYDLLGNHVNTLVNQNRTAGYYNVMWNGMSKSGEIMPTGTYFYRITAGSFVKTKKMVLVK